ncbi:MarR family transcriptional regulator [Neobacillus sp. FSL H8-0543]|uniref:MarR family winged helix-turn-helix transcriptional regulator n=1 Tax=Neobacillus sp. FSL H8-0543 TaxID=2954672 RepID=UPI003158029C
MADLDSPTAQKLLNTFMQFKKTDWHDKKIAGYNPSEFKVLAVIKQGCNEKKRDMKVSEISRKLHVTPPTVTQIINILEKDGLVERSIDQDDRRAVRINITAKGEKVTSQAKNEFTENFLGLIDYLGDKESEQLAELLSKVIEYYLSHK